MRDVWTHPWTLPGVLWHAARRGISRGECPVCDRRTLFYKKGAWLREHHCCLRCGSITRWRALAHVLDTRLPRWREVRIHESSPCGGASDKLARECPGYVATQLFPDVARGATRDGFRCEDLEAQTFADGSFDLVITQDVLEHVFDPARAFAEIARTLVPGGSHVFTVPWDPARSTLVRARREGDVIRHLEEPAYHRNPIDPEGSLVVTEWGHELIEFIHEHAAMTTEVIALHEPRLGIVASHSEVFLSRKPVASAPPP